MGTLVILREGSPVTITVNLALNFQWRITMGNNVFTAGTMGKRWAHFIFVADYQKTIPDIAMVVSKFSFDRFDRGSKWATSWNDVVHSVKTLCEKEKCKVALFRLSCHGNQNGFKLGSSVFTEKNKDKWKPEVEKIAKYFDPNVSFVTIDACKTGQNQRLLQLFSEALGGVKVRGYEKNQSGFSTTEENDRGNFITCKVEICQTN